MGLAARLKRGGGGAGEAQFFFTNVGQQHCSFFMIYLCLTGASVLSGRGEAGRESESVSISTQVGQLRNFSSLIFTPLLMLSLPDGGFILESWKEEDYPLITQMEQEQ